MPLDILALPEPLSAGAGPNLASIRLIHCQAAPWRQIPPPAPGPATIWEQLGRIDGQIKQVMDALEQPGVINQLATVKSRARDLADRIFSEQGKQVLKDAAVPDANGRPPVLRLHLMPGLDVVPWELLFDGTDFLGLRFQIARLPVVPGGPPDEDGTPHVVKRISSLVGENVLDEKAMKQWRATFKGLLNGSVEVFQRPAKAGDWPNTSNIDGSAFGDIVHITCHGITENGERFWSLNDQQLSSESLRLYATDAKTFKVEQTFPLVFANACASASAVPPEAAALKALAEGFGTTFYDTGARSFVGTFAPVTKTMAVEFANRFFNNLLKKDGLAVGEALLETKKQYQVEDNADPSWLFYCLYGDPTARFVVPKAD